MFIVKFISFDGVLAFFPSDFVYNQTESKIIKIIATVFIYKKTKQ